MPTDRDRKILSDHLLQVLKVRGEASGRRSGGGGEISVVQRCLITSILRSLSFFRGTIKLLWNSSKTAEKPILWKSKPLSFSSF